MVVLRHGSMLVGSSTSTRRKRFCSSFPTAFSAQYRNPFKANIGQFIDRGYDIRKNDFAHRRVEDTIPRPKRHGKQVLASRRGDIGAHKSAQVRCWRRRCHSCQFKLRGITFCDDGCIKDGLAALRVHSPD
jgi:hypothetical protein